jgi:hypothetical protein
MLRNIDIRQCLCGYLRQSGLMANFVFRCPQTGFNVQHSWPDDRKSHDEKAYETVACPACTRMHLINKSTGKPLGYKD